MTLLILTFMTPLTLLIQTYSWHHMKLLIQTFITPHDTTHSNILMTPYETTHSDIHDTPDTTHSSIFMTPHASTHSDIHDTPWSYWFWHIHNTPCHYSFWHIHDTTWHYSFRHSGHLMTLLILKTKPTAIVWRCANINMKAMKLLILTYSWHLMNMSCNSSFQCLTSIVFFSKIRFAA